MAQKTRAVTDAGEKALYEERVLPVPQTASSIVTVTRHLTESGRTLALEEESETIEVRRFEVEPAEVGIDLSVTVNLGNYSSCRVAVSFRAPCYYEERDECYEDVASFVKSRLGKERDEIVEWAKGRGVKNKHDF